MNPIPVGVLAALTVAVVAAHLVVVEKLPMGWRSAEPLGTQVFTTRTLRPQATPEAAASPEAAAAKPAPAARPRTQAAVEPGTPTVVLVPATTKPSSQPEKVAPPAPPEPVAQADAPAPVASAPAPLPTPPTPRLVASAPAAPVSTATASAAPPPLAKDAALEARTYVIPGSVRLKFNATGQRGPQPQNASGEMLWQHDGRRYEAHMEIGAFGLGARSFSSTGALTADGLAPTRFADKRRTEVAAHFDRDQGRVVFSPNVPPAPLQPGAQDQLSIFVQLASMVAGEPHKFPVGATVTIQTVGARSAEPWVFTVEAPETLTLPGGKLATIKLVRNPGKDYDQKVELWLAPELSYLPARIRISFANGDFVDQQWRTSSTP